MAWSQLYRMAWHQKKNGCSVKTSECHIWNMHACNWGRLMEIRIFTIYSGRMSWLWFAHRCQSVRTPLSAHNALLERHSSSHGNASSVWLPSTSNRRTHSAHTNSDFQLYLTTTNTLRSQSYRSSFESATAIVRLLSVQHIHANALTMKYRERNVKIMTDLLTYAISIQP